MNERLKEIRKSKNLSQAEFAKKLGFGHSTLAMMEIGKREILDRHIKTICSIFEIDEHWFRTGEGDMVYTLSEDEQFAALLGELLVSESEEIKSIIMKTVELDSIDLKIINQLIDGLIEKNEKK
ncbi:helix-turn-helix domain-containing protein [Lysinibacillus sp. C5.1]|uniref:helix-turn-helix domain-containing protein n=1 Tax=Lysinibacillus sp. C5.1 TaxID=2796169 RepID=UPI0030819070